jgi:hypothetical protein
MAWQTEQSINLHHTTKLALRAGRNIAERKGFTHGFVPSEIFAGALIKSDSSLKTWADTFGISAETFFLVTPSPHKTRLNFYDHPDFLIPEIARFRNSSEPLQPTSIMHYLINSNHTGLQGVFGLSVYRRGFTFEDLEASLRPLMPLNLAKAA